MVSKSADDTLTTFKDVLDDTSHVTTTSHLARNGHQNTVSN